MAEAGAASPIETFTTDGFRGEVSGTELADVASAARWALDPANAVETIHWGRNYLYSVTLDGTDGPVSAVVKLFRNQGWRARLERRLKGSKAQRSWEMALAMRRLGLPTPEPLLLLESEAPDGPSLFVTRLLEDRVEARYLFRALKASSFAEDFPGVQPRALAAGIGALARRMHDAGIWHRDFSIGNLLVRADGGEIAIDLVDLNRARRLPRVSLNQRVRDLCRLGFYDRDLDETYLAAYWSNGGDGAAPGRMLYRIYRGLYLARVEGKKKVRGVTRSVGQKLFLRKPYAHIAPPEPDADARDKSVWDELSDQPHQHASRLERLTIRARDAPSHARAFAAATVALRRARRRYDELRRELWTRPPVWPGVGVAVGPGSAPVSSLVEGIGDLGVDQVLLRLHPWEPDQRQQLELARRLAERGVDLTFALPQVRELVRDRARWRAAVRALGEAFLPWGRRFQVGQAINRSKWGLWNYREYVGLLADASTELRDLGEVEILGPGVIDFEPHAMAAALNYPGVGSVDICSSLLYVDRRGAPENEQLGFDALGKAAMFRAIGETSAASSPRYWITEFNWPLWEGPHSPAGRAVSVDEQRQASYLVRYCLPILGSGIAERAYWWQVVARGYGLVDPRDEGLRRRPAFAALATLSAQLSGARVLGPEDLGPGTAAYRYAAPGGEEGLVAWSLDGETRCSLPVPALRRIGRDGEVSDGEVREVILTEAPCYLWLGTG